MPPFPKDEHPSLGVQYAVILRQDVVHRLETARRGATVTHHIPEQDVMTKERKSNREDKKKPAMTPKEKKAAKKAKKESKESPGIGKTH